MVERSKNPRQCRRNPAEVVVDFTALLLDTLGYTDTEFVSIGYDTPTGAFPTAVGTPTGAPAYVDQIPTGANVFFGVNPTRGPARKNAGRGKETDVTRLAALVCDLDVKPGSCPTLDVARAIAAEVGIILGTKPSVIVDSGHGLHAYWPIADGHIDDGDITAARALVHRFGRLVAVIAGHHNVAVDNVYELARMLRVPGTLNNKTAGNGDQPKPVVAHADTGGPLEIADLDERLTEHGIPEEPGDTDPAGEEISAPAEWQFAENTCPYTAAIVAALPSDGPPENPKPGKGRGRHQWAASQAVKLTCALRLGCITETDWHTAQQHLRARLGELRAATGETVPRHEISGLFKLGRQRTATKTDEQCRAELGEHTHDVGTEPDQPDEAEKPTGAGRYFNRAGLRARTLLNDCEKLGPLAAGIDGKVWAYTDGVWVHGDRILRHRVVTLLGERYRRAHADTVESMVQAREPFINDTPSTEYLNVENGLLEWRTGRLHPHTPNVPSTTRIPVRWNPDATCPNIDKFLRAVVDAECVPVAEEVAGYALYPDQPLHKAIMLDGNGRNGKGVFLLILGALLGAANITAVPPQRLDTDKWAAAQLYGKLANLVGDVDPRTFKETATFKQATGQDLLQGEHKYCSPFYFTSRALIVAAFNSLPRSVDTTEGFFSRWLVIPFPNRFADLDENGNVPAGCHLKDPDLTAKVITTAELEGFLVRAVEGLRRVMGRGQFTYAEAIADAQNEFRRHADPVRGFLSEKVIADPDAWVSRASLHAAFKEWAVDSGLGVLSARRFTEKVREVHVEIFGYAHTEATRTGDRGWAGIRLRISEDEPDQVHRVQKVQEPRTPPPHAREKGWEGALTAPNAPSGDETAGQAERTTRRPGCICTGQPQPCYWCQLKQGGDP